MALAVSPRLEGKVNGQYSQSPSALERYLPLLLPIITEYSADLFPAAHGP